MSFPRLKKFNFDIESTYKVPADRVGKLLLIANEKYGDVRYYKAIAEANNIRLSAGCRNGIRPVEEALRLELANDGYSETEIENLVYEKMVEKRISQSDWNNYHDTRYGYISDVSEGTTLLIPTFETATAYLDRYEIIQQGR